MRHVPIRPPAPAIRGAAAPRGGPAVLLLIGILLACPAPPAAAQPAAFTDVTPPFMRDVGYGEGAAWGDLDDDGDLDLVVANEGQYLRLYRNEGGSFVEISPPWFGLGVWTGTVWGDYDNDGDLDLYVAQAEHPSHLFRNDGGLLVEVSAGDILDDTHKHGTAWTDYDNDGDLDLFYAVAFAGNQLLRNDGGDTFVNVTPPVLDDPEYGRGCAFGDYDDDGDADLVVANFTTTKLYRNDGGTFANVTAPPISQLGHAGGVAWGDYDNDGDFDLVVGKAFTATSRLYRNEGGGAFADVTPPAVAIADTVIGVSWADYDNDADLDLHLGVWSRSRLLRNDGGVFTDVANPALANDRELIGVSWGDYDGDGDLDVYYANNQGKEDRLLRNDLANGNHWLHVALLGTQSNRSGIGARVEVWTGGLRQVRAIEAGTGYNGMNSLRATFGLAGAAIVDSIRVRWPSGIVQDTAGVTVDQVLTLAERGSIASVDRPAPPRAARATPNPFRSAVAIEFELAAASDVRLSVHDLSGRRVRRLEDGRGFAPGRHTRHWDGRDDTGRRVPAGLYFWRLEVGGEARTLKLVRVD